MALVVVIVVVVITMFTHGNYETDMGCFNPTSNNGNVGG